MAETTLIGSLVGGVSALVGAIAACLRRSKRFQSCWGCVRWKSKEAQSDVADTPKNSVEIQNAAQQK